MKRIRLTVSVMVISMLASAAAYAGKWRTGAAPNETRWRYENDDGTYASSDWFWLDGNRDGIAECYYFDSDGWMLAGTVTPDGYTVNADGAWTENGTVRTQAAQAAETQMEGENHMIPVTISVGGKQFEAALLENPSVQALIARMPLTVNMSEMNGNEKYYYLPSSLPTDTQNIEAIHTGDLMLFGSDCLVLFYEDFNTSYRYTRLGSISDPVGLSEALGSGNVQVTFELRP